MTSNNQILNKIKSAVRNHLPDANILLFGSRVRMDFDVNNDYDILIISEKNLTPQEKTPFRTLIRKELLASGIRSNILIQSQEEVKNKKKLPGHIIRNILTEAIVL
jgi:predicted nucleotidyltransferase